MFRNRCTTEAREFLSRRLGVGIRPAKENNAARGPFEVGPPTAAASDGTPFRYITTKVGESMNLVIRSAARPEDRSRAPRAAACARRRTTIAVKIGGDFFPVSRRPINGKTRKYFDTLDLRARDLLCANIPLNDPTSIVGLEIDWNFVGEYFHESTFPTFTSAFEFHVHRRYSFRN